MYAPVVSRFHTYAVEVAPLARAYMDAVMALPAWGEWRAAALAEPWVLPEDEVDWPTVLRRMKAPRWRSAVAFAAAASMPKKCRGSVLIPARERKKYTLNPVAPLILSVPPGGVI